MNETAIMFLAIIKSALLNDRPMPSREITANEWQVLFHLASIHNVLPLFYEATYEQPSLAAEPLLLATAKQKVRRQVIMQSIRTNEFLQLNSRLLAAGIKPVVVKGIVCRNLYRYPDHRPSSDEDVLISEDQFEICHKVLTEFGMAAQSRTDTYEVPYRKEGSPLYIELHKSLFPPENDAYGDMNRFFGDMQTKVVTVDIQGHCICTLAHTDHLFYLICHAFKHFLHSGFGIRQVCDIALYANAYGLQVDWKQMLENCKAIHAEKFAAAIFAIGKNYLVFNPEQAAYPAIWQTIEVDEIPMLNDLLCGGLYGDSSMSRKHSSNITLDAVASQKSGKKVKSAFVKSLFPSATKLEGRYPYLKKHPYLLPAAWCNRLLKYAQEIRNTRDSSAADALNIGTERIELMKIYGILE